MAMRRQQGTRAGSTFLASATALVLLGFAGTAILWAVAASRAAASTAFHLKARLARRPCCPVASSGTAALGEASAVALDDPERGAFSEAEALAAGVPEEKAAEVAKLSVAIAAEGLEPLADPLALLRFYNARGQDVEAAAAMYRETVEWRRSYGIQRLMAAYGEGAEYKADGSRCGDPSVWAWRRRPGTPEAEFASRHAFFGRLEEASQADEPLLLWRVGTADYAGIVREDLVDVLMRAWVVHLEDALQAAQAASFRQRRLIRARLVVDAQGFSIAYVRYLPILRKVITVGKQYYPEVTATVTILRAPSVAAQLFKLVKPLLTPLMVEKISILGEDFEEGLRSHAGLEVAELPAWLGGRAADGGIAEPSPIPVGAGAALRDAAEEGRAADDGSAT